MTEQEKSIKEQLKKTLPYGSNAEIKRRLEADYSRILSSSMIGNVVNPEKEAWDNDVISVALDLASEEMEKRKLIVLKAGNLQIS